MFVQLVSSEPWKLLWPNLLMTNLLWQDSQPQTIFRSSLAKCKGTTVSNPLNRQPTPTATKFPSWTSALQSKVGQSEHQITSLYLHHNIFPWSLLLHILSQYWQTSTHTPERILQKRPVTVSLFWFYFHQLSSLTWIQVWQKLEEIGIAVLSKYSRFNFIQFL